MSQRDVERLLGRLILDPWQRDRFFEYPMKVLQEGDYDLSERELRALLRLDESALSCVGAKAEALSEIPFEDDSHPSLWADSVCTSRSMGGPSCDGPGEIEIPRVESGEE